MSFFNYFNWKFQISSVILNCLNFASATVITNKNLVFLRVTKVVEGAIFITFSYALLTCLLKVFKNRTKNKYKFSM